MRRYNDPSANQPVNCAACTADWNAVVKCAATRVAGYFDGLCLDCVLRTAEKDHLRRDQHYDENEYWDCLHGGNRFDRGCRIQHGGPTWYFSFIGQQQPRQGPPAHFDGLPYRLANRA
ncbi:hypothetical protein BP00DRAFT_122830 [Aspergillus indologenus CBS 114.80]|uniref:Uncharacterized protein n=1 Tax=Aspergillus indologenus CBS 114.80 TaxID=1450541 RepID=A0A2V5JD06_9EURO|nr:hypothetical protein BP00DRAFT_122830 [Aspergillus indologenus CBS 114.80]